MRVSDGGELRNMALRLRTEGHGLVRRRMGTAIRTATRPAAESVQAAEKRVLPKAGGLNDLVGDIEVKTQILAGQKTAGVRVVQRSAGHDLKSLNRGRLRHPTWGHRDRWVDQEIPAGWWEAALEKYGAAVLIHVELAMAEAARAAGFIE